MSTQRPDIRAVLEHYYGPIQGVPPWADSGRWKMRCPLPSHTDRHGSASVDFDKQRLKCFGCDTSMDSYDIIQEEEAESDFQTIKHLAEERGWLSADGLSGAASRVFGGSGIPGGSRARRGRNRKGRVSILRRSRTGP